MAQAELALKQEMFKECTFRPEIKPLPASYGQMKDDETPFYTRVNKWQKDKESERLRKEEAFKQSELDECTFKPQISKNSELAVRMVRGESNPEMTSDRLYKSYELSFEERAKLIESEKVKALKRLQEDCTFKPQLSTKKDLFNQVHAKFSTITKRNENHHPDAKECTFTPKVLISGIFHCLVIFSSKVFCFCLG
jgi:hypothetical protein